MNVCGSVASYTIKNVEKMMKTITASNFREYYDSSILIDDRNHGPYIRTSFQHEERPISYVFTITNWDDNDDDICIDCSPKQRSFIMTDTVNTFDVAPCLTGNKRLPIGDVITSTYEADIPRCVIHYIRNTFNNLFYGCT